MVFLLTELVGKYYFNVIWFRDFGCCHFGWCSPYKGPNTAFALNFAVEKCYLGAFDNLKPWTLLLSDEFKLSSIFSHQKPQIKF